MTTSAKTDKVIAKWRNIKLQPDEMVIREFTPGFAMWHVVFLVLTVLTSGVALPLWIYAAWANTQTKWAVTNRRLLERKGVFNKRSIIIDKDKITDIEVHRPLLAQVFHNGKVLANTAGSSGKELTIKGQSQPDTVADEIRDALSL